MRKKRRIWPMVFVMTIGVALLLYPTIAQWFSYNRAQELVAKHQQQIASQSQDQAEMTTDPLEEAAAFNQLLAQRQQLEVLSPTEMQRYLQLLNPVGDGVMGTLSIPKLKFTLPIGHTASDEVLQKCIGHMPETSLPIGGKSTHAVLAGHSGLANARLLTDLPNMALGDTFILTVLDQSLVYRVDQIKTVLPEALKELAIIPGEDHVTLLTCVPYGINSHRLLVRGVRVP